MPQGNADHQLGALDARVTVIERALLRMDEKLDDRLEKIDTKVGTMNETLSAAKGGWRTLVALGAIVSALGAAFGYILHLLFNRS